ncbi:multicopper oxidase family protein [Glaciibacter superstes]|uniref:multicopper oxidase family protein n=1 Tax=Glaciibacter superstes TaxID=501023 RepID=UPI0003B5DE45|nr:multicopper oxidase family protein [Glaciibacter superstes]
MQPISRRNALLLGGIGAVGVLAGGAGLTWALTPGSSTVTGLEFVEPEPLRSVNGRLQVRLSAAERPVQIAGRQARALTYNGGLPGPTLFVRPGDRLNVTLDNGLRAATNLHVHGLHVSPQGNSDNVLLAIDPGTSFDYEYRLPDNHPPGVYWYHPHHHGSVADQLFGGLYGAIVVEDPDLIPISRERILVVSDISLDSSGRVPATSPMDRMVGREGNLVLVNGQLTPHLTARPAERERWRIVNACVSRYLRLRLDGQQLQLLGIDSGRFSSPQDVDEVLLAPGNRADLLVTTAPGTTVLRTLPVDRGTTAGMMGGGQASSTGADLVTLDVSGDPAASPGPIPAQPAPRDLRTATVTARRELTFAMGMGMGTGMMSFTIDGKSFDPARVDTTVRAGAIEEWTLTNTSPMDHPIHLHVWPMQIIEQGGRTVDAAVWQDVVNVPARDSVRVRIPFDDFTGKTVYHCHILDHEDEGMMGIIEAR